MRLPQIINSLLETDMYKFSMGQTIFHQFTSYKTTWTFKCRNKDVHFTDEMVEEIKEQVQAFYPGDVIKIFKFLLRNTKLTECLHLFLYLLDHLICKMHVFISALEGPGRFIACELMENRLSHAEFIHISLKEAVYYLWQSHLFYVLFSFKPFTTGNFSLDYTTATIKYQADTHV